MVSEALKMWLMYSFWRKSIWVRDNKLEKPIMPFSGVRISWLILAKNSDLIRLA